MKIMRLLNWTRILILGLIISGISFTTQAQQWTKGDSLNTQDVDSSRIDIFRGNVIGYTGQDLLDASFPNSIPYIRKQGSYWFSRLCKTGLHPGF
jgi:hypothetical protein